MAKLKQPARGTTLSRPQTEIDDMTKRFLIEGQTLEEIGVAYNLSRARVHQILKKVGVDTKNGGAALRIKKKAQEAEKDRLDVESEKAEKFGLSLKEFLKLKEENGNGIYMNDPDSVFYGYMMFKRNQQRHYPDIPFNLSFSEWLDLWKKSGLERNKSNWMIRKDRDKPFEKKNMKIVPSSEAIRLARGMRGMKEAA
jgi:hypothetical protein